MRRLCSTLALAAFVWMSTAAGATPLVRVTSPLEGRDLPTGSLAVLEWEPLAPFDLLQAEEWEAFLSVDGGAHYPLRITPHLDSDLRRILWQVPATPTRDARLLLRFGDEHDEVGYEVPLRFAISGPAVLAASAALAALAALPSAGAVLSSTPGEPARPGDSGVALWVEGSRRGGSIRQVSAELPQGLHPGGRPAELVRGEAVVVATNPNPDPAPVSSNSQLRSSPARRDESIRAIRPVRPAAVPILLLIGRQNE
ncbi:MAG TPA: hypothetical protein VNM67_15580 [Thermoanaerobaculia bacterium]|jgi:hypothetical protein|nr:hypothetical protein [Thermoanaerobaculia bacterium]